MAEINGIQMTPRMIRQIYSLMWESYGWGIRTVQLAVQPDFDADWSTSAHLDNARRVIHHLRIDIEHDVPAYIAEMYRIALHDNLERVNWTNINGKNKERMTWIDVDKLRNMYHKYKM